MLALRLGSGLLALEEVEQGGLGTGSSTDVRYVNGSRSGAREIHTPAALLRSLPGHTGRTRLGREFQWQHAT